MTSKRLTDQIELSLFAALIFISVELLRIPVGTQFIHLGNALVVVAVLLYGARRAALVAAIGLGLFDMINGYAAVVWITVLEALVVCYLLHVIYEKLLKSVDKPMIIVAIGLLAAAAKLVMNLVKYSLIAYFGAQLPLSVALWAALGKISGSLGTALVTVIAVPLLYPVFKQLRQAVKKQEASNRLG
ncbi:TPA: ECF transporter S component [Streptococcus equi subsp. zooepidemicus]|uniref:ECF transporter S component n=1 Tax=Streptococcus equi TaxID=1336 RepID=UPI001E6300B5|nr:ECF transporter S component [Streptococcus equi]MCD3431021.1 ECF transporter S component [Streptococcus equi subsp. zooepidemicus]HEL0570934.1 ECF transporter S component [Streptococcus equi subsp. zooepidemicus]HEL0667773.1 ECF transporter S component [Streptococcus equi subsp. zooepidemicus]HEL0672793.1 ECF transporter S component [Streptococcus equi subsp. zooepidemicus]HEL1127466.1 ECF transporter S component [Streptococcus equi subsp. zooepidemicus]